MEYIAMIDEVSQPVLRRVMAPSEVGVGAFRLISSVIKHRQLVLELARRELSDMHAGQSAGGIWLMVHPLLLFFVYAFLFTLVFRVRIADQGPIDYLVYLLAGLSPWLLTQDVIGRSPSIMLANVTIVKKVMFPTEVLVAKTVVASVAVQFSMMVAALLCTVYARGHVPASFLLIPALALIHLILLWGLSLLLSAITPYFRDVPELVRISITINIYLIPVMYLPKMVPAQLQFLLGLNPFSYLVWCYQDAIYYGTITRPLAWLVLCIFALLSVLAGSYLFLRLRHHFASVL
jgi:lipopolysaccharide transport system permease protein